MPNSRAYRFGAFTLKRDERALYQHGCRVPLGDIAVELLLALVEHGADVITKAALMRRVWPTSTVDESTLRFHVATLRKALGDGLDGRRYIVNVSGRGYCFVAPVERQAAAPPAAAPPPDFHHPARGQRLLGRERALEDLKALLARHRFVSVVGAGGMGKSSLVFAAAEALAADFPDGVFVLDVALIGGMGDGALVESTLAHQIGVVQSAGSALAAIGAWFRSRKALLILDSCETQIDACAVLAKGVLEQAAGVCVLTTSREALRVKGEWVQQLKPLGVPPPPWQALSREAVLAAPAVQLVVERARALDPDFALPDAELPLVCELVSRLDGMPLAIELASARLHAVSLRELLDELDSRRFLRGSGLASAVDRHRTLGDLLDWSYERLSPDEQTVLRRLSVCNGAFSLETAQAVAAAPDLSEAAVVEAVFGLEVKSLLSVEAQRHEVRFRLLDSTRAYAADRLGEGEEHHLVRIQQCVHLHDTMLRADTDAPRLAIPEWMALYGNVNNDMRANLAWGFGPRGEPIRAIRLVAASVSFAHRLALAEEYGVHIRLALERLAQLPRPEPELEIALLNGLFVLHLMSRGPGGDAWSTHSRIQALAEQLDSRRHRIEALNGMFVQAYFGQGDYLIAQAYADEVAALAAGDPAPPPLVQRLQLQALHGLGQHEQARLGLEPMLTQPPPRQRLRPPFPIDMSVMARMLLVRIHWLQGRADDAIGLVGELLALAERDVRFALANAYAWSIVPLYLWCRDLHAARGALDEMHRQAAQIDMHFTAAWACAFELAWSRQTGQPPRLPDAVARGTEAGASGVVAELLGTIDPHFVSPGLLARRQDGTLGWCAPEILRAEGELLLARGGPATQTQAQAQRCFEEALLQARQHGALAWQLRAANSLARLFLRRGQADRARAALEPVLEQFRQGLWTGDVKDALELLAARSLAPLDLPLS